MKCPQGHNIPYVCKNGAKCTPKWCGETPFQLKKERLKDASDPDYDKFKERSKDYKHHEAKATAQAEEAVEAATDIAETTRFGSDMNAPLREAKQKQINLQRVQDTIRSARDGLPPEELDGDAALAWVKDEIARGVPEALLRIRGNLKYGTDTQKDRAAERWLDMAGFSKGEQKSGGNAPIIMLNMGGLQLPWAQPPTAVDIKATLPPGKKDEEK